MAHNVWHGVELLGLELMELPLLPPMGNGRFARDGLYNLACHWRQVNYVAKDGALIYPKDDETEEYVDKSGCYNLINGKFQKEDSFLGYVFIFGGPGGSCDH
ncbi:hypothetical protein L1049_022434 [Liquidambar formosana]|uniref:Neprosin PEP catalytic domain-containing protein n=1 Tax=Liquidambar formosana TaxID=63359 RepID=A0AAP0REH3_LIQFO